MSGIIHLAAAPQPGGIQRCAFCDEALPLYERRHYPTDCLVTVNPVTHDSKPGAQPGAVRCSARSYDAQDDAA